MKLIFTLISMLCFLFSIKAQTGEVIDFENFNVPVDGFINGDDGAGGFLDKEIFFPNLYNTNYNSWSGWALSSSTDTLTPGFMNQYASISGIGVDASPNYAVTFVLGNTEIELGGTTKSANGFYVNNATYAYLSMRDGDSFAKKFGGVDGTDPDYFLLTIKGLVNGIEKQDSIDFYLADFRSDDSSEDYIINDWTWVDLNGLGQVDQLIFTLSSSDNGAFGMNTPAYFCIDNFEFADLTNVKEQIISNIDVIPNPANDWIQIKNKEEKNLKISLLDINGRLKTIHASNQSVINIPVSHFENGLYTLHIISDSKNRTVKKIIINH